MIIYLEYARRLPHTGGEVIFVSLLPERLDFSSHDLM
jgi:hypothetical protein